MNAVKVIKLETTNSIPESQRPVTIGFGSVPGGTGCTTLACQFAVHAANMRNRTLAISVDRSGDLVRRLVGDMVLQVDTHWKHPDIPGLRVSYCPPEILTEEYEDEDRVPDARVDLLGVSSEPLAPSDSRLDCGGSRPWTDSFFRPRLLGGSGQGSALLSIIA
jgi:hypothetical protein